MCVYGETYKPGLAPACAQSPKDMLLAELALTVSSDLFPFLSHLF